MNRRVEAYLNVLRQQKIRRRKILSVVVALSVIVSGTVSWQLHGTGNAMTNGLVCAKEEHVHDESCYSKILTCGYDPDVDPGIHVHDDTCYEKILICEKEEHVHNADCRAELPEESEGETIPPESEVLPEAVPSVENTVLPLPELSGNRAEDIVSIALSQVGYVQSGDLTFDENGNALYRSAYGDWYGRSYGNWNTVFVAFCLNKAGITENEIAYNSGAWAWQVMLSEKGLLTNVSEKEISEGSIVFIDSDLDGKADRCAIVVGISDALLNCVEGDVDGKTALTSYPANGGVMADYLSVVFENEPSEPEVISVPTITAEAEVSPAVTPYATVTVTPSITPAVYGDKPKSSSEDDIVPSSFFFDSYTASGIEVMVMADGNAFPEGTVMKVRDVEKSIALEAASETVEDGKVVEDAVAVDITFINADGSEIEPSEGADVSVSIRLPEEQKLIGEEHSLIHLTDEGACEVEQAVVTETSAEFNAESFSIYVVTALGEDKDKDKVREFLTLFGHNAENDDGEHYFNKESSPYIMREGDKITLAGVADNAAHWFYGFNESILSRKTIEGPTMQDDGTYRIVAEFTAISQGETAISFEYDSGHYETFYVKVIPDADTYNVNIDTDVYNTDHPLVIKTNDRVIITGSRYMDNEGPSYFYFQRPDGQYDASYHPHADLNTVSADDNTITTMVIPNGVDKFCVNLRTSDGGYKSVCIEVQGIGDEEMLDHADIEVADGGIYTSSKIYTDGSLIKKTVTEYKSYVKAVNDCTLYDVNKDPVTFYRETGNKVYTVLDNVHGYAGSRSYNSALDRVEGDGDYWQDPAYSPGQPQFELTSKYIYTGNKERSLNGWGYEFFSEKKYYYSDVDSAVFDVQLELHWQKEMTYVRVGDEWVLESESETEHEGEIKTIENAVFDLNRTAVIDAYNKCPNHSGLDFTIKSSSAMVEIEAGKELSGGRLKGNDFTFEVYDPSSGKVWAQAQNTSEGQVLFDSIHFEKAQDQPYELRIREVQGTEDNIKYDTREYKVKILVTEQANHDLVAEVVSITDMDDNPLERGEKLEFLNKVITLPETGGIGRIPILASGAALSISALWLLIFRKRKIRIFEKNDH